jgi:hypothetical protein
MISQSHAQSIVLSMWSPAVYRLCCPLHVESTEVSFVTSCADGVPSIYRMLSCVGGTL